MNFAVLGRRKALLDSAQVLIKHGCNLKMIQTTTSEDHYDANESDYEEFAKIYKTQFINSRKLDMQNYTDLDFVISHNWINLVPINILELPKFGFLNAHPGDLPRYRGNACLNWAILNEEDQIGLTIHKMDGSLDSGPIVTKSLIKIDFQTNLTTLYEWIDKQIPSLFHEAYLKLCEKGNDAFVKQSQLITPLRCLPRIPEDSRIDWTASAFEINKLIRASTKPLSGAFTFNLNGERVRVFESKIANINIDVLSIPGSFLEVFADKAHITTGDGVLEVTAISRNSESSAETFKWMRKNMRNRFK